MRNSRLLYSLDRPKAVEFAFGLLAACALFVGAATLSSSSAAHGAQDNSFTLKARSELVLLDVCVRYPKDGFVLGLKRDNFEVYEEGRKEPITQFGSVDSPVTIGLVVDASGSMRSKRAEVVEAGLAFAKESNPHDEFFVVNFNDRVVRGLPASVPFTDSLDRLRRALYYGPAQGKTALYDAVALALKHSRLGSREKRTLIIVSDGGDNASKISLDDLVQQIQGSLVTIYAVALVDPEDPEGNLGVLRKIVQASGGEFFLVPGIDQVASVFHQIAQSVRNRYTIGYVPDPALNRETALRHVRVVATEDGRRLVVKTRTSYRLDATEDASTYQGVGVSALRPAH
jgi:Ca-activated chloride channel family protein